MNAFFSLSLSMILLAGCQQDQSAVQVESTVELKAETSRSPAKISTFGGIYNNDERFKAVSWNALVASLSPEEKAYLEGVNNSYYGVLEYESAEELAAMKQLGIPLPSDFMAAARLSDNELEELARAGNPKAQLLYSDRLINNAKVVAKPDELDDAFDRRKVAAAIPGFVEIGKLRDSKNPFAAYLDGRLNYEHGTTHSAELYAAALMAGGARGDIRSKRLLEAFSEQHPRLNGELLIAAYNNYGLGK